MRILRSEDKITVDQEKYIENLLEQFNITNWKPKATPGEVNSKLVKNNGEHQLIDTKLYRSLVGSLLYIGKQTRPDILNVVNQLESSERRFKIPQGHDQSTINIYQEF